MFANFLLATALFSLGMALAGWVMGLLSFRLIRELRSIEVTPRETWPTISLIAPARNEERNIEEAMRSLLAIDYPRLQITIINDRSTDKTGEILARLSAEHPRLNVVTITELPPGWLGKNYAMHLGAQRSSGEWLLFSDADVVFHPLALKQAITYVEHTHTDHLSAFPDLLLKTWHLDAMCVTFAQMLISYIQPWRVRDPHSKCYMGVGAFNLTRAEPYRQVGGHVPIRMRPDDDLKLGQLIKMNGYKSDVVRGNGSVMVEWYASLREMIRGLEKNSSAPLEYAGWRILGSCVILFFGLIWPFIAMWFATGTTQMLFAICVVLLLTANMYVSYSLGKTVAYSLFFPVAMLLFIYIQLRSYALLLWNNGMQWRDTHYSLEELMANRI